MRARAALTSFSLAAAIMAAGCGPARIETSTEEAFSRSMERVRSSVAEEQRGSFDQALDLIKLEGMTTEEFIAAGGPETAGDPRARLKRAIDGKTAEEVVAMATELRRERVRLLIQDLEERQHAAQQLRNELNRFELQWAYFKWERTRGGVIRKIELQVVNGTGHHVSAFRYNASLSSPDRSTPWGQEQDSYYSLPGGVAAGERKQFDIFIPDTSALAVDTDVVPIDVDLELEITALYGPENESLAELSQAQFSARDAAKLAALEAELG